MNAATKSTIAGIGGLALAVPLAYLFDPDNGRQRRAALGAQCSKAVDQVKARSKQTGEQLSDRYQTVSARARSWFTGRKRPDETLASTVRMNLYRAVPPLTGVGIVAHNGEVILHGDVLAQEHDRVLQLVGSVPGVTKVVDHLSPVATVAPQTIGPRVRQGFTVVRDSLAEPHWSAPTRVGTGAVGVALLRFAVTHRNVYGGLFALAGAALLARSLINQPLRSLGTRRETIAGEARDAVQTTKARAARASETLHSSMERRDEKAAGRA
jgi:hypothetical protein